MCQVTFSFKIDVRHCRCTWVTPLWDHAEARGQQLSHVLWFLATHWARRGPSCYLAASTLGTSKSNNSNSGHRLVRALTWTGTPQTRNNCFLNLFQEINIVSIKTGKLYSNLLWSVPSWNWLRTVWSLWELYPHCDLGPQIYNKHRLPPTKVLRPSWSSPLF